MFISGRLNIIDHRLNVFELYQTNILRQYLDISQEFLVLATISRFSMGFQLYSREMLSRRMHDLEFRKDVMNVFLCNRIESICNEKKQYALDIFTTFAQADPSIKSKPRQFRLLHSAKIERLKLL